MHSITNNMNREVLTIRESAIRMIQIGLMTVMTLQLPGCDLLEPGEGYQRKVDAAWSVFHAGDYPLAELRFSEAIAIDNTRSEAWLGRGWSRLLQEHESDAAADFTAGDDLDTDSADFQAGLTLVHYLMEQYLETVVSATHVLSTDTYYRFTFIPGYDYRDIRFLRASANFASGESGFAAVITDINHLAVDLALGFELADDDPATWTIMGVSYETLPAALTAALDMISGIVS